MYMCVCSDALYIGAFIVINSLYFICLSPSTSRTISINQCLLSAIAIFANAILNVSFGTICINDLQVPRWRNKRSLKGRNKLSNELLTRAYCYRCSLCDRRTDRRTALMQYRWHSKVHQKRNSEWYIFIGWPRLWILNDTFLLVDLVCGS